MAYTPVPASTTSGGGSSIGSPITGTGGNNRVLGIDGSGNLKDFADLTFDETTNDLTVVDSESGGTVGAKVSNTSNTASSHAEMRLTVGGTSGGAPSVFFEVTGGTSTRILVDNADGDMVKFVSGAGYPAANAAGLAWNPANNFLCIGRTPLGSRQGSNFPLIQANGSQAGDGITISTTNNSTTGYSGFTGEANSGGTFKFIGYGGSAAGTGLRAFAGSTIITSTETIQVYTSAAKEIVFGTSTTERMSLDTTGNVLIGTAAVATTATDGFLYVTSCAGAPTGVPTAKTGRIPIVVDSTNNKLYFYSGAAWRDAGP